MYTKRGPTFLIANFCLSHRQRKNNAPVKFHTLCFRGACHFLPTALVFLRGMANAHALGLRRGSLHCPAFLYVHILL